MKSAGISGSENKQAALGRLQFNVVGSYFLLFTSSYFRTPAGTRTRAPGSGGQCSIQLSYRGGFLFQQRQLLNLPERSGLQAGQVDAGR